MRSHENEMEQANVSDFCQWQSNIRAQAVLARAKHAHEKWKRPCRLSHDKGDSCALMAGALKQVMFSNQRAMKSFNPTVIALKCKTYSYYPDLDPQCLICIV